MESLKRHPASLALLYLASLYVIVTAGVRCMLWLQSPDPSSVGVMEALLTGSIYDGAFLAYALLPVALLLLMWKNIVRTRSGRAVLYAVTFVFTLTVLFVAVSEWLFWEEFQVRFNFIAVDYLVYRREVTQNINESYPIGLILGSLVFISAGLCYAVFRSIGRISAETIQSRHRLMPVVCLSIIALFGTVFLDQDARERIRDPLTKELGSNGPYQFFASFRNNELDYEQLYPTVSSDYARELLQQILKVDGGAPIDPDHNDLQRNVKSSGDLKDYNVVLITVESLSAEYLARFGNDAEFTPNLDALIGDSLFFSNLYATGTRTTRGLEAVTLSIPPTPGRSVVKRIGRETNMWSLGNVLNTLGYESKYLYGGRGYFDNMAAFFSGNGYQVVDQSSVPDEQISFSNAWGMADEDLFNVALSEADVSVAADKPFFQHVMTTSNHRPYTYPEGRVSIPSGTNRAGAVMYTDFAIGEYLAKARQRNWFDKTIFIIVADHCAGSAGKVDLPLERYHIPMWVYAPSIVDPSDFKGVISQIDIAPTILGLLNASYTSSAFGVDVLAHPPNRALIGNYQYLGFYDGENVTILKPKRILERLRYEVGVEAQASEVAWDKSLKAAVAYYQGAARVLRDHLNAWQRDT